MPYNLGAISDKNRSKKGILCLNEVTDGLVVRTPAADSSTITFSINLGELSESSLDQTTSKTEFKNEAGVTKSTEFEHSLMTTGTLMERDKVKVDFLSTTCRNKIYLEYKYAGVVDGKHQEYFKFVQVTPQHSIKLPGGASSLKYEATGIYPDATATISSTNLAAIETALSITIYCTGASITPTAGYVLKETAVT